jgi:hypothetical protein
LDIAVPSVLCRASLLLLLYEIASRIQNSYLTVDRCYFSLQKVRLPKADLRIVIPDHAAQATSAAQSSIETWRKI